MGWEDVPPESVVWVSHGCENCDRLEAEVAKLKAELKSSKEIQLAEKNVLISEIEKNAKLNTLLHDAELLYRRLEAENATLEEQLEHCREMYGRDCG